LIRCEKVLKKVHFLSLKMRLWPDTTKSNLGVD